MVRSETVGDYRKPSETVGDPRKPSETVGNLGNRRKPSEIVGDRRRLSETVGDRRRPSESVGRHIKNIIFGLAKPVFVAKSVGKRFYELSIGGNEAAKSVFVKLLKKSYDFAEIF